MNKKIFKVSTVALGSILLIFLTFFRPPSLSQAFWVHFFPFYIEKMDGLEVLERSANFPREKMQDELASEFIELYQISGFSDETLPFFIPCSTERMKLEKIACHNELSKIIQTESFQLDSKQIRKISYSDVCDQFSELSTELDNYFIRLVPNKAEQKGTILLIHGRATSPIMSMGICDLDYMNGVASYWLQAGFQVILPKVTAHIEESEKRQFIHEAFLRDLISLEHVSGLIKGEFAYAGPVIIYGISYGDALANIISYSKSDVFTHYISSGGIWRTDAPKLDEYEAQDEVNVFYFSDAFLNGVHVKTSVMSSSYDWGRISNKTKKNLMNEFGEAKDNIVIFSGLHEANPELQLRLVSELSNERK